MKVFLNGGVSDKNVTVIPKSALDAVTTSNVILTGRASAPDISISGAGMGWDRASYKGHEVTTHIFSVQVN